ncbi:MAG TPA: GGDEF domain-containing protein [Actinomycetota bacterium]
MREWLRHAQTTVGKALEDVSDPVVVVLAVAITVLVGVVDVLTGSELSFGIFYLSAIGLAAWFATPALGFAVSVLCALTWFAADRLSGATYSNASIPYWNGFVRLGFFLVVAALLSSLRKHLLTEEMLARTDPLTGVANPRAFLEALDNELYRTGRYRRPLSLAYIDLDGFKAVNERLGHSGGDEELRFIAQNIRRNLRASDLVGRLGGDEFAVLLPETGAEGAQAVSVALRERLQRAMEDAPMPVTLSVGIATFESPPASSDEAIRLVDRLMYEVKDRGKDQVLHRVIDTAPLKAPLTA